MALKERLTAGASMLPLALGLAAPAAHADGGGQPLKLAPVPDTTPKGGPKGDVTTQDGVVTPGRSYRCIEDGTLRRAASSYVMGWCLSGMHIDISASDVGGWQPGYAHGNYEHCGWFQTAQHDTTPEGVYDHNCGTTRYAETHFASAINTNPANGGSWADVLKNCTMYLNVKPWDVNNTTGYDPIGTLNISTDDFYWRYASKNGYWVLGQLVRNGGNPLHDWVFVQKDCVGAPASGTRAPTSTVP